MRHALRGTRRHNFNAGERSAGRERRGKKDSMKTTLAGASPIEQFVGKLKDSGIDIDLTHFRTLKIRIPGESDLLVQRYLLNGGYELLLASNRGWLLIPVFNSDDSIAYHTTSKQLTAEGEIKLLPESEIDNSVEYVRQIILRPLPDKVDVARSPEKKECLKAPQPSPDGMISSPGRTRFPR